MRLCQLLCGVLLLLLSACRPAVEEAIPCDRHGDLACPSGFRCGAGGFCEPGEGTPQIELLTPAPNATAAELLEVSATARAAQGLRAVDLRLESTVSPLSLAPRDQNVDWTQPEQLEAHVTASFDTYQLPDGEYRLRAWASARDDVDQVGTAAVTVNVINGRPHVTMIDPVSDLGEIAGTLRIEAQLAFHLGIDEHRLWLESAGGRERLPGGVLTDNDDNRLVTLTAGLETWRFDDGAYHLEVEVISRRGAATAGERSGAARFAFHIANGMPQFEHVAVQIAEPYRRVSAQFSVAARVSSRIGIEAVHASLIGSPAEGSGTLVVPPLGHEQSGSGFESDHLFVFDSAALADGTALVQLEVVDIGGRTGEFTEEIEVDNTPPEAAGEVHWHERIAAPSTVTFACSEEASFEIRDPADSVLAEGACDSSQRRVELSASQASTIRLVDTAGNVSTVFPTLVTREHAFTMETAVGRTSGGALSVPDTPRTPMLVVPYTELAEPDGTVAAKTVETWEANDTPPVLLRPALPLVSGEEFVLPMEVDGDVLRFAVGQGSRENTGLLTMWEMNRDLQITGPVGTIHIESDRMFFPAFHPRSRAWVMPWRGKIALVTVDGVLAQADIPSGVPAQELQNSVVCGDRFVAAGTKDGYLVGLVAGLGVDSLDVRPPIYSERLAQSWGHSVALVCDGTTVAAIVSDDMNVSVFFSIPGGSSWREQSIVPVPPPRFEANWGPGGLYGGGFRFDLGQTVRDLWRFSNSSFQQITASGGPLRRQGLLVEAWGRMFLLGGNMGRGVHATVLERVGSEWREERYPTPLDLRGAGWRQSTFDFERDAFVYHGRMRSGGIEQVRLIDWPQTGQPAQLGAELAARQGAGVSWDPASGRVFVHGGIDAFGKYIDELWSWDGHELVQLPDSGIPSAGGVLAHIRGLRYWLDALFPGGERLSYSSGGVNWSLMTMFSVPENALLQPGSAGRSIFAVQAGASSRVFEGLRPDGSGFQEWTSIPHQETLPLPWRSQLTGVDFTLSPMLYSKGGSDVVSAPFARTLSHVTPYFVSPAPRRRAVLMWSETPALEINDEPRPGFAVTIRENGPADVSLCASTSTGSRSFAAVDVFVSENGLLRNLPPGDPSGSCERRELSVEPTPTLPVTILVFAAEAALTEGVTVELDQFVVSRTEALR